MLNQPKSDDVIKGRQVPYPANATVLEGLERVKQLLEREEFEPRIDAFSDALQYGQEGLDLVIQALDDKSERVQEAAYLLLQDREESRVKTALQEYNPYLFFECLCTIQTDYRVFSIAISSDRQILVTDNYIDSRSGPLIKAWNLQTQQESHTFQAGSYPGIHDVAITPDNQILGITGFSDFVELWNIQTWQKIYRSSYHCESFRSARFSADGQTFMTRWHDRGENEFCLWDVKTKENFISYIEMSDCHHSAYALCSNSQTLVTKQDDNGTVNSWDWETGELTCTLKGHVGNVNCAIISSHLRLLLGGTDEHTIIVWNLWTGQKLSTLKGHSSSVNCITLSPDGQTLVTSSDDGMIKVWGLP